NERSPQPPRSKRRKHSGTPRVHESSPDERSLRHETPKVQPVSSSWPLPPSTPSAHSATATKPSANSGSSAVEFTAAHAQGTQTETESRRSPHASSRSPSSSSTAGPIPRSLQSCS